MTGPIDTIREALERDTDDPAAFAALTEVEQQLAKQDAELAEAEAAAAGLVAKWQSRAHMWNERAEAAERRANELADALREVGDLCFGSWDDGTTGAERNRKAEGIARAALDRHTQGGDVT